MIDRDDIDAALAARLVAAQFPRWADLPVTDVEHQGWDNRTFRLGDTMSVRLPTGPWYAQQVAKEQRWLPRLAGHLPRAVPVPLAAGVPGDEFPYPWSVYRWLPGRPAAVAPPTDLVALAADLGAFLCALAAIPPADGPAPGEHNWFRGAHPEAYDAETRAALATLGDRAPEGAHEVWEAGLASRWTRAPVWFHGDVADGNLLVVDGRLDAVIDFGCCGVGDPACDLTVAWTLFDAPARAAFRAARGLDDATWARGRAWAVWKALITLAGGSHADADPRAVLDAVVADHRDTG